MSPYRYNPGDTVLVRDDLKEILRMTDDCYKMRPGPYEDSWEQCREDQHCQFKGRIVTIDNCEGGYHIKPLPDIDVDVSRIYFVDDMLLPLGALKPCYCVSLL